MICLGILWPSRGAAPRSKVGLICGIVLLLTGIFIVMMMYPAVNYYKVVPKTAVFLGVTVINIVFERRALSQAAYFGLLGLTFFAACIAIFH